MTCVSPAQATLNRSARRVSGPRNTPAGVQEDKDLMRQHYQKQLKMVHDDLLRMGSRVEHSLSDAMKALTNWDSTLAKQVIAGDAEIDSLQTSIEEAVLRLMATQQPILATDLRTLNATVSIANELERSGDYAKGIAKRVLRCLQAPTLIEVPSGMLRMGTLTQQMVQTSLDSFVKLDVELARSLADVDEKVDALEDQVVAELLDAARKDPVKLDAVVNLLDVAHVLERMADRSTNIAERVIFIATNVTATIN